MEMYGEEKVMEGISMDPVEEWVAPGGETGLEEPMWQLGLRGCPQSYPERPDEPDCIYYLKTGFCGYGDRCRFNHPPDRSMVMGDFRSDGEYPERAGQPLCQYYMKTGTCKFGATCKYHHPKHEVNSSAPVTLNIFGYPLRSGERECSYYVKTGQCKFGSGCKFHHPPPSVIDSQFPEKSPTLTTPTIFPNVQRNWPTVLQGSYVPGSYGPMLFPSGVIPIPWTPYPAPLNPGTSHGPGPVAYPGPYISIPSSSTKELAFPQRHGEQECQYYLKTGDCKFGATCKYHHPTELNSSKTSFILTPMGLPLRPGARICSHYSQNGVCKFGPSCKFDHPVAPYPVGSKNTTFVPSSSNLRPEILTELNKDNSPPQISSSDSIFSRNGAASELSIQHSGTSLLCEEGEVKTSN